MAQHAGGCLCGKVRFRVKAAMLDSGYCHCRMCQRNSGAPLVAWAVFPTLAFEWTEGAPQMFAASAEAQRFFCSTCGSYMVFRQHAKPEQISVNSASFDEPNAFPPRSHIFWESRLQWLCIEDDLPKIRGYGDA